MRICFLTQLLRVKSWSPLVLHWTVNSYTKLSVPALFQSHGDISEVCRRLSPKKATNTFPSRLKELLIVNLQVPIFKKAPQTSSLPDLRYLLRIFLTSDVLWLTAVSLLAAISSASTEPHVSPPASVHLRGFWNERAAGLWSIWCTNTHTHMRARTQKRSRSRAARVDRQLGEGVAE